MLSNLKGRTVKLAELVEFLNQAISAMEGAESSEYCESAFRFEMLRDHLVERDDSKPLTYAHRHLGL